MIKENAIFAEKIPWSPPTQQQLEKIGKKNPKRLLNKKKVKKAPIFANTKSFLLIGEAVIKTVLSSPFSFGFLTKSEIPEFINIAPRMPSAQKDKNIVQIMLKTGGS